MNIDERLELIINKYNTEVSGDININQLLINKQNEISKLSTEDIQKTKRLLQRFALEDDYIDSEDVLV